jgi:hypothetical protein
LEEKMMNISEMKIANGSFEYEGKEFILTDQAYLDDNCYKAIAICLEDTPEDGWQTAYNVRWEILDDYYPEGMQEDMACNWAEPEDVRETGEYNLEENRFA